MRPCGMALVLADLSEAERDIVTRALAAPSARVSGGQIARELRAAGYPQASQWLVNYHRRGDCSCRLTTSAA